MLKTNLVFIDTQAFDQMMFDFEGPALRNLRFLGKIGQISLLVSDVINREVESHIRLNTAEALTALNTFQKKAKPFKSLGEQYSQFFASYNVNAAVELAVSVWYKFLDEARVTVLGSQDVDVSTIVDCYFKGLPPFAEVKKKTEFPDAISLGALSKYLKEKSAHAYVIGKDKGVVAWCANNKERVTSIDSISSYLDIFNKEKQPELTQAALERIRRHENDLKRQLFSAFSDMEIHFAPNAEAEVEFRKLLEMTISDVDVVEVDVEKAVISALMYVKAEYHVSGPDYDQSVWDSEDKEYVYIDYFSSDMEDEDHYEVTFVIDNEAGPDSLGQIHDVEINGSPDSISIGDEEWY